MVVKTQTPRRVVLRILIAAVVTIFVLGLIAPFINVARYSAYIQRSLEASFGRKVEFRQVHLTLFSGPGLSLQDVTIHEDPRYGIEPFAYVPTLDARVRIGELLTGHIRFSKLRLIDPALNFVKRSDGTWNAVELVQRVGAPGNLPMTLLPAVEISGARIDFKFGTRKTTLYIADSDLSVYPERLGKLYMQFSGSPARTDRAGTEFGHFRGSANWYLTPRHPGANQLEADVTLDPSNLSEITTLFEGYDAGLHGTVSSHARIEGPLTALRLSGRLRIEDLRRWDLFEFGEDWQVPYQGNVDLVTNRLDVETTSSGAYVEPVTLELHADNFLTRPDWSVAAHLNNVPAKKLLPLSRRLGVATPTDLALTGTVDGLIGYSSRTGLAGALAISDIVASRPDTPSISAAHATATIAGAVLRFDPAIIGISPGAALTLGGEYDVSTHTLTTSLKAADFPIDALNNVVDSWFEPPAALSDIRTGRITGQLLYIRKGTDPSSWIGHADFRNAKLSLPGFAAPIEHAAGRIAFNDSKLDLTRFSGVLGDDALGGEYHYNAAAKYPERVRVELTSADLFQIESELGPTLEAGDLLSRLRFRNRALPPWLAARNLEADIVVHDLSLNHIELGALRSRLIWQGANLRFNSVQLDLAQGQILAHGTVNLSSYAPRCQFAATVAGFPWRGGTLTAQGEFETSGTGADVPNNLHATGTFSGEDVMLSADDVFAKLSGLFDFSFEDNHPSLRLSHLQASDGADDWNGEAVTQSDGTLLFDLEYRGRQRRIVSSLAPERPVPTPSSLTGIARQ